MDRPFKSAYIEKRKAAIAKRDAANREERQEDQHQRYLAGLQRITNTLLSTQTVQHADDEKRAIREKRTIAALVVTLVVAPLGNLAVHHDSVEALQRADAANDISKKAFADQLVVLQRQADVMQGQLEQLKSQQTLARIQLAARMRRDPIRTTPLVQNGTLVGWEVNPTWTNVGNTEARDYIGWFSIQSVEKSPSGEAECPTSTPEYASRQKPIVVTQGAPLTQLAELMSREDVLREMAGTTYIFIFGHIEYRDIFPDTPRHTFDWCVVVVPNDIEHNRFSFVNMYSTSQ